MLGKNSIYWFWTSTEVDNISPVGTGESRINGLQRVRVRCKPAPNLSAWNYCGVCQEKMRTNNKGDTRRLIFREINLQTSLGHLFFSLVKNLGSHSSLKCLTVDSYIKFLKYSFFQTWNGDCLRIKWKIQFFSCYFYLLLMLYWKSKRKRKENSPIFIVSFVCKRVCNT